MDVLIDSVVKSLGGVLVGVLVAVAVKLLQRFGIALDVERQQQLESAARAAVLRIEELAASTAKSQLRSWTGPEKLSAAITDVVERIPRVDRGEAERIIQAVLPSVGIGAAAGAAELGNALRTQ